MQKDNKKRNKPTYVAFTKMSYSFCKIIGLVSSVTREGAGGAAAPGAKAWIGAKMTFS